MKHTFIVFTIFTFFFLSCEDDGGIKKITGDPKSKAAEEFLRSKIQQESKGLIQLTSYTKTNGLEQNMLGMKMYTIEYSITVSFTKHAYKTYDLITSEWTTFTAQESAPQKNPYDIMGLEGWAKEFAAGRQVTITGSVTLEETENGWRGVEYENNTSR